MRNSLQWRTLLVLPLVALALALVFVAMPRRAAQAGLPHDLTAEEAAYLAQQELSREGISLLAEYDEDLEGFSYQAGIVSAPGEAYLSVNITYDWRSRQGLLAFGEANRRLAAQLREPADASIVFRRPLELDEFRAFVAGTGVAVESYVLRAVDSSGTRHTIFGAPDGTDLLPSSMLGTVSADLEEKDPQTALRGVITVEAQAVTPAQLATLLADERVFTVDVSGVAAAERARARFRNQGLEVDDLRVETFMMQPVYWSLEDYGIAPG